ncbi:MAG: 50S ribosomal protein L13 [Candidatus Sungiibacteriota bacterium]|uniref:Large ribosomal subunit protein uL13 n=1 Tax=Candidatus Sungiibacteriota bacterium TaxID=2750080 RepID=A0A7T5RJ38_9BACT|nr:MAG: 50S ribosomal protein L13 [Candidatus Sungbacteria bacterium]
MEYKIDAANKILGRLATEVVVLLRGKNSPSFDPARMSGNKVIVFNTDKIRVSGKKLGQKLYRRHSGYHGGLKEEKLREVLARDSRLVLRRAVMGMLPKNRLRKKMIKDLILVKEETS